jgi:site-specific DNA-methyltransferase (adenine-specific)
VKAYIPDPYYEDEWVRLYHADAREILGPDSRWLPFPAGPSVLLTDPPYGINGGSGGDARNFAKGAYLASAWEDTPEHLREVVVPVVSRCLAYVDRGAVTPGAKYLHLYPDSAAIGCFWTPAAATHGPWGFNTMQPILYYGRDPRSGIGALPSGRLVTEAAPKNGHPCPKPLGAWKWLLDKVSQPGETVVDPFAGSGTTLRAAKDLGRFAIGIEIEERYCKIAAEACAQDVLDLGAAA